MTDRLAPDVIALDARFAPLAEATQRIERLPLDGLLTYLVETVPAAFLPELGRQFHISPMEGWQFVSTDADRRRLIREAIALHRRKGTPWALRRALAQIGVEAEIIEPADQRRIYTAFNPLLVNGSWRLDGTHTLRPIERLAAVPQLQHWASFFVRINLATAASADLALLRQVVREWAPVSRHPILLEWLALIAQQHTLADHHLRLDKRLCVPYAWPGEQLHGCPKRAWRLGRDGDAVRLPAAFGSFRVGERRGAVAGRLLAARRAQGWQAVRKTCAAWAWRRETLPPDPQAVRRRLDGSWRIGAALRIGRFRLDGRPLTHASFTDTPPARLRLSGQWQLGQPRTPLFEMRSIHV
jgi:phage tail P2-like protein